MNTVNYLITTPHSLACAHKALDAFCAEHPSAEMELSQDKRRSEAQNRMIYALYAKATKTPKGEGHTALDIKCLCKLTLAIPILYTEDKHFRDAYRRSVKYEFTYEKKIKMMAMGFPVTSMMSTTQVSQYIKAIGEQYGLEV